VAHEPGKGRHRGRLGALLVEMANGIRFAVGTGLSDHERLNPPGPGAVIRIRYQELSDGGVPRFPSYLGIREDIQIPVRPSPKGEAVMANATRRRFTYVEGRSDKFWEIAVAGAEVTVHFGRNGTTGQSERKVFASPAEAARHAEKKIGEKLKKGYRETA
jgi:DNA ligase 1